MASARKQKTGYHLRFQGDYELNNLARFDKQIAQTTQNQAFSVDFSLLRLKSHLKPAAREENQLWMIWSNYTKRHGKKIKKIKPFLSVLTI